MADNLADASQSFIFAPTAHEILAEALAAQDSHLDLQQESGHDGTAYSRTLAAASQSNFASTGLPSSIGPDLEHDVRLSFHVTSILNCSINIAWSRVQIDLMNIEVSKTLEAICNGLCSVSGKGDGRGDPLTHFCPQSSKLEKVYLFDVPSKTYIAADGSPFDEATFEVISDYLTFLVQFSGLYGKVSGGSSSTQVTSRYSSSSMRLAPDTTLAFHQVNAHLGLVYVVRNDLHTRNGGMIVSGACNQGSPLLMTILLQEYNISIARKAIMDVYNICTAD